MAYEGFKKLKAMLAKQDNVKNPAAVAAQIGRNKYGKSEYQKAAAQGHSLRNKEPKK